MSALRLGNGHARGPEGIEDGTAVLGMFQIPGLPGNAFGLINLFIMNPTESTELQQLREEVAALRRDLDHVLRVIGQDTDGPDDPRPRFLCLETETIGVRHEWTSLPILLKAHEDSALILLHDSKMRMRGRIEVNDKEGASFQIWNAEGKLVVPSVRRKRTGGRCA